MADADQRRAARRRLLRNALVSAPVVVTLATRSTRALAQTASPGSAGSVSLRSDGPGLGGGGGGGGSN